MWTSDILVNGWLASAFVVDGRVERISVRAPGDEPWDEQGLDSGQVTPAIALLAQLGIGLGHDALEHVDAGDTGDGNGEFVFRRYFDDVARRSRPLADLGPVTLPTLTAYEDARIREAAFADVAKARRYPRRPLNEDDLDEIEREYAADRGYTAPARAAWREHAVSAIRGDGP